MRLLSIDPGPTESAYVIIDDACRPLDHDKIDNNTLAARTRHGFYDHRPTRAVIEMIASYGMPVGADVFETCVWIGRYEEAASQHTPVVRIPRLPVKLHLCHSSRATDATIRRALVDRFTPGQPNHGKGTNTAPGWFHGFHSDIWQAYALAVYAMDTTAGYAP